MASNPASRLTEEEYLAIERAAEFKSEFLNGEMSNRLGGDCEALSSDLRVKVSASGMETYPDVLSIAESRYSATRTAIF